MTWDSIDSRAIRPRRPSSRSTSRRASAGSSERGELGTELLEVVGVVVLAEFPTDRLHLLAEEHLALALAELLLDLRLDVLLGVHEADLALDVDQHPPEPVLHREGLEERLPLDRGDVEVSRHQVGESAGVVHPGQHLLDDLLGQPRLLAQLGRAGARLAVERHEGRVVDVERGQLLGIPDHGVEIAVLFADVHRDAAPFAVEEQLHAGQAALQLSDSGDRADGVEVVGGDLLDVLPLGDREHQLVRRGQRGLDGAQGSGPTGADRRGDSGEEHDVAERKDGNGESLGHFEILTALSRGRKWQGNLCRASSNAPPMPPEGEENLFPQDARMGPSDAIRNA